MHQQDTVSAELISMGHLECSDVPNVANGVITCEEDVKCLKCFSKEIVYVESNCDRLSYCDKCFLKMVKWKFRSALSKRKIFRDSASRKVLVVLDGSKESAFLFRQIEDAVKQTNFKRLMIEPYFVLVLSSVDTSEIRVLEKNLCILQQALSSTYFVIHLAAVFGELHTNGNAACQGLEHLPKLIELSNSFQTASLREEMIRILEVRLLQEFAQRIGISKVMISCNSDQLAGLMLNQLCLGRGGSVSNMTDVIEKTLRGTTFIRPLRHLSSEEISTALRLENVEHYVLSPCKPSFPTFCNAYEASTEGSVQRSTAVFLGLLTTDGFQSTLPSILSSATKIHVREGTMVCALCEYSFLGNAQLCYTCSEISKELPLNSTLSTFFTYNNNH